MNIFFTINLIVINYLNATCWVLLVAMFTFSDPSQTRDGHVSFELSLFHGLMTVFVRTGQDLVKTSFQVSLQ